MASKLIITGLVLITCCAAHARNVPLETNEITDHYVTTSINFIFDLFLKRYTKKLIEEGKTAIQIGDFERSFHGKILSVRIEGSIKLSDGWCSNISTLHRTGDADMDKVNKDIVLSAHLGLGELEFDFDHYDISLIGAHQRGKLHATVGDNSVYVKLNAQVSPTCLITLEEFRIEKLENIRVDITNLGIFENLTDEISSWVVNEITKWYRHYIENMVLPELAKAIKDADLCHYIPI